MARAPAWLGLAVVLGALAWPWWLPGLSPLLAGAWVLATVALVGQAARTAPVALFFAAFLLGNAACAIRPEPSPLGPRASLQGQVRTTSGYSALVEVGRARWWLRFREPAPPVGAIVVADTRSPRPAVLLPGDPDPIRDLRRWRAGQRAVASYVVLGPNRGDATLPPPFDLAVHGGLLYALTGGPRALIPETTATLLRRTGTSHLLAISGLHVGLVGGAVAWLAAALLQRLDRWRHPRLVRLFAGLAGLLAALLYAGRVGWPVSTRRAVAMLGTGLGAWILGRRPDPWNLLGIAAFIAVLVEPGSVAELGFQLSFGAVVGMLLVGPRITRWISPDAPRPVHWLANALGATIGATAGTLPAVAWKLQALPSSVVAANLIAGPLLGTLAVPASLLAGLLPGVIGRFALALGDGAAGLALDLLALVEGPVLHPAVGPVGVWLLGLALLLRRRPLQAGLFAILALGLHPLAAGRLFVTFLAVGQGDAALVEWPDGRAWLVDGGPPGDGVLRFLRRRGLRHLDAIILSHPHPDHLGGLLPVIDELEVDALWLPRPPEAGEAAFLALWQGAFARGIPIHRVGDPGLAFLHPGPGFHGSRRARVNDESLVMELDMGLRSFLFTGDVEATAERALAPRVSAVDVVKVPHHGSRTSSGAALVAAADPLIAVISCGRENRYRHPNAESLAAWRHATLLRTDRDGTIEISTDGEDLRLRTWRNGRGWTRPADVEGPPRAFLRMSVMAQGP